MEKQVGGYICGIEYRGMFFFCIFWYSISLKIQVYTNITLDHSKSSLNLYISLPWIFLCFLIQNSQLLRDQKQFRVGYQLSRLRVPKCRELSVSIQSTIYPPHSGLVRPLRVLLPLEYPKDLHHQLPKFSAPIAETLRLRC